MSYVTEVPYRLASGGGFASVVNAGRVGHNFAGSPNQKQTRSEDNQKQIKNRSGAKRPTKRAHRCFQLLYPSVQRGIRAQKAAPLQHGP